MKRRLRIQELRRGSAWAEITELNVEWYWRWWHDCAEQGCCEYAFDDWCPWPRIASWSEGWTNPLPLV